MRKHAFVALLGVAAALLSPNASLAEDDYAKELVIAAPGGNLVKVLQSIFEPFEEKYGIDIKWESAGSATEILAKVTATKASPVYDAAFGEQITHYTGHEEGVWAEIDESIVTNWSNLVGTARPTSHAGVGYGFFFGGIFYRPEEFEKNGWAAPTSWDDLFKQDYCGRVGLYHPKITYGLHLLYMRAGTDVTKMEEAIDELAAHGSCLPVLETSAAKFEEKMQVGEYVIGNTSNIRAVPMAQKGVPIQFVIPEEGVVVSYATAAPVKNDAHPERVRAAQMFVNWLVGPEAQTALMEQMFFTPTNTTVQVPDELRNLGMLSAEEMKTMPTMAEDVVIEKRQEWVRMVDRKMAE